MQLVEQGKLDLNEDITTYLPQDFVSKLTYEKPITMNQIMSHTAGFEDYYFDLIMSSPEGIDSLEEVLISRQPKQIYKPSTLLKSGTPLSVETPAPPKKTILLLSSIHSLSFSISLMLLSPNKTTIIFLYIQI